MKTPRVGGGPARHNRDGTSWTPARRWRRLPCLLLGHRWASLAHRGGGSVIVLCNRCAELLYVPFLGAVDHLDDPLTTRQMFDLAIAATTAMVAAVQEGDGAPAVYWGLRRELEAAGPEAAGVLVNVAASLALRAGSGATSPADALAAMGILMAQQRFTGEE